MEFTIPLPESSSINKSSPATLQCWHDLMERFNSHDSLQLKVTRQSKDQKQSMLSFLGGKEILEMFKESRNLSSDEEIDLAVEKLLDRISYLCLPKFMLLYERYKFFSMFQSEDECVHEFLTDLLRVFECCDLPEHHFRDRIVAGVVDISIRNTLKYECYELKDVLEACEKIGQTCVDRSFCALRLNHIRKKMKTRPTVESKEDSDNCYEKSMRMCAEEEKTFLMDTSPSSSLDAASCPRDVSKQKRDTSDTKKDSNQRQLRTRVRARRTSSCRKPRLKLKTHTNVKIKLTKSCRIKGEIIKSPSVVLERTPHQSFFECHICHCHCSNKESLSSHLKSSHNINILSISFSNQTCNKPHESTEEDSHFSTSVTANCNHDKSRLEVKVSNKDCGKKESNTDLKEVKNPLISALSRKVTLNDSQKTQLQERVDFLLQRQKLGLPIPHQKRRHTYSCECSICGKSFRWPGMLTQHYRVKHPGDKVPDDLGGVCTFCGKMFKSSTSLHKHESMHTRLKFPCDLCDAVLVSKRKYDYHMNLRHGPKDRQKPFVCEVCGKSYRFRCGLVAHSSKHCSMKPFKCDKCEMSFKKSKTLQLHLMVHKGEGPYKCRTCGECFIAKKAHENHIRKHSGEKPFTCATCGLKFRTKPSLSAHCKIHDVNRPRPYVCTTCGYSCPKKWNLDKHMLKHTGEKPHKCPICDAGFTTSYGKNKHLQRIHGIQDPKTATVHCQGIQLSSTGKEKVSASLHHRKPGVASASGIYTNSLRAEHKAQPSIQSEILQQQQSLSGASFQKHPPLQQLQTDQPVPTLHAQLQVGYQQSGHMLAFMHKSPSGMTSVMPPTLVYNNTTTDARQPTELKTRDPKDGISLLTSSVHEGLQSQQTNCHFDKNYYAHTHSAQIQHASEAGFGSAGAMYHHSTKLQNYCYPPS